MSHPVHLRPSELPPVSAAPAPPLRLQIAVVRALLDDLERRAPAEAGSAAVEGRLGVELERLGREALRMSSAVSRGPGSAPRAQTAGADEDLDPIPHWLPLVAF